MSQLANNFHSLFGAIASTMIQAISNPANASQIERLIISYLNTLLGSSVERELALDVAKPLMADALGWIVTARQKAAQGAQNSPETASEAPDSTSETSPDPIVSQG